MKPLFGSLALGVALAGCAGLPGVPPGEWPTTGERWGGPLPPAMIASPTDKAADVTLPAANKGLPEAPEHPAATPFPIVISQPAGNVSPGATEHQVEKAVAAEHPLAKAALDNAARPAESNVLPTPVAPAAKEPMQTSECAELDARVATVDAQRTPIGLMDVAARPAERDLLAGWRAYDDAQYAEAEKDLASALQIGLASPRDRSAAHKLLAFIYCTSNRIELCETAFRVARAADPSFTLSRSEAGHPVWGPVYRRVLP